VFALGRFDGAVRPPETDSLQMRLVGLGRKKRADCGLGLMQTFEPAGKSV
jgi:hypothetical protein